MKCAWCFTFLLQITVTVANFILPVFEGETVQLFPSTVIGSHDITVLIYVNGNKNILIARWTLKNCAIKLEKMTQGFEEKLFMDSCRNIWIRNVSNSDEGTYTGLLGIEEGAPKFDVNLTVSGRKIKEDQIQKWMEDHPDFSEKYIGEKITEEQIEKWLEDHPDFSKKNNNYGIAIYLILAVLLSRSIFTIGWFLCKEYVRMKQHRSQKLIPYIFERFSHLVARQELGYQTVNNLDQVIMNPTCTSGQNNLIPDEDENESSAAVRSTGQNNLIPDEDENESSAAMRSTDETHPLLEEDDNEDNVFVMSPVETCPLLEEDANEDDVSVMSAGETEALMESVEELKFISLDIDRKRSEAMEKLKRYGMTLPPRKRKFTV